MRTLSDCDVPLKMRREILAMGRASRLAAACLRHAGEHVRPGGSTATAAESAVRHARDAGARDVRVFTSVNDTAAHGEPDTAALSEGDVVTVDVSLDLEGWYGDVAWTYIAGRGSERARALVEAAWWSSWAAVAAIRRGTRITQAADCARSVARRHGFTVAEMCSGHGIGRGLHEPPVLSYTNPSVEGWLVPGMAFTVEPVLTLGDGRMREVGTALVTRDGAPAATFEHTVAILAEGPVVLNWGWGPRHRGRPVVAPLGCSADALGGDQSLTAPRPGPRICTPPP